MSLRPGLMRSIWRSRLYLSARSKHSWSVVERAGAALVCSAAEDAGGGSKNRATGKKRNFFTAVFRRVLGLQGKRGVCPSTYAHLIPIHSHTPILTPHP